MGMLGRDWARVYGREGLSGNIVATIENQRWTVTIVTKLDDRGDVAQCKACHFEITLPKPVPHPVRNHRPHRRTHVPAQRAQPRYLPLDPQASEIEALLGRLSMVGSEFASSSTTQIDDGYAAAEESLE